LKNNDWDKVVDVVVVGYGYAGGIAAVTACDSGAKTILLEKRGIPGGISSISGGGFAVTENTNEAYRYLLHTTRGTTPTEVLRTMARGMKELPGYIDKLRKTYTGINSPMEYEIVSGATVTYPGFPGSESIKVGKISRHPEFEGFDFCEGMRGGARLFKIVADNVSAREIEVRYEVRATDLITESDGRVVGIRVQDSNEPGNDMKIGVNGGVVLATGGFEADRELKTQFLGGPPLYPIVNVDNTGEGLRMSQRVGARLWHMKNFHGSYGFRFSDYPLGIRNRFSGMRDPKKKMPWILLDEKGERFMNEYPPAIQDTPARTHLFYYDPDLESYPRIPAYMLFDEEGRKEGPIGFPMSTGSGTCYSWSEDNQEEIKRGWINRASDLNELSEVTELPVDRVVRSVEKWNDAFHSGGDKSFNRPAGTMMSITNPPYYWVKVWPVISNTQGGPAHDEFQRILNVDNEPIPGLYAAGELGSLFGHLYMLSGNITECFVGGRIAGRGAARKK